MKQYKNYKRIVVKIGSSILVNQESNKIKGKWLKSFCEDIKLLMEYNKEIVIVTSGAVALWKKFITSQKKITKLEDKQAAAAAGQIELIKYWQQSLLKNDIKSAQLLLTLNDSEERRRYLNARNTMNSLLANNIIPVINENDTVATEEIKYGDNDRLAARVSQMIDADLLILLSDIDGLYDQNPIKNKIAKKINEVFKINKALKRLILP